MNYLTEAFKALDALNEDVIDISEADSIQQLNDFINGDIIDTVDVIDAEAENEEELSDSYVGQVILDCCVCHSPIFKDKETIIIDEETDTANIEDECPYCHSNNGYKILGEVKPFAEETEVEDEVEEIPADTEVEEVSEEEALTESMCSEAAHESDAWSKLTKSIPELSKFESSLTEDVGSDLSEYQKWVDYDMKKYGKVSDVTQGKISKAGLELVKDDHGDYEVIAKESEGKDLREGIFGGKFGKHKVLIVKPSESEGEWRSLAMSKDFRKLQDYEKKEIDKCYREKKEPCLTKIVSYSEAKKYIDGKKPEIDADILDEELEDTQLSEDFKNVSIETDETKMEMTSDESGKVTVTTEPVGNTEEIEAEEEVIVAPNEELISEIEINSTAEDEVEEIPDDVEVDLSIEELDEEPFEESFTRYFKENYSNVKSFKVTSVKEKGNSLIVEGKIKFDSDACKRTELVLSGHRAYGDRISFLAESAQITPGRKAFKITGKLNSDRKFITESLNYRHDRNGKVRKGRIIL